MESSICIKNKVGVGRTQQTPKARMSFSGADHFHDWGKSFLTDSTVCVDRLASNISGGFFLVNV
jgi:hypothetical protein